MRFPTATVFTALGLGLTVPSAAQDGPATLGFFMTVDDAAVPDLEDGIRRHNQWHVQQGDPWTWEVWSAVTGRPEYAYISAGHNWADFDAPPLDLGADAENWAETGAPHTIEVTTLMWEAIPWGSRPPATTPPPMVEVIEFRMNPGGEEKFAYTLRKFAEAAEATNWPVRYVWAENVSGAEETTHFVVVPMENIAQLGIEGPEPPQVLIDAYGETEARAILAMFNDAMTFVRSRIWTLRPDLSINLN